jgi:hypothetical protein
MVLENARPLLQGNEAVRPIFEEMLKPTPPMWMSLTIENTGGTDLWFWL